MPDPVFIYCNGPAPPRARQREAISLDWRRPSDTLNLDPELMDAFLSRDMPDRMRDLLEIAAYIYAADGMISRGGPVDTGVGGDWRRTPLPVVDAPPAIVSHDALDVAVQANHGALGVTSTVLPVWPAAVATSDSGESVTLPTKKVYNVLAAFVPPGVVTSTLAVPAVPAGAVAVMVVAFTTVRPVAAVPPIVTAVAPVKPVPVIVTVCPPANGPDVGLMDVTVGAA